LRSERKIAADAVALDRRLGELSRPIVFTNGCFDILHRGHVAYLEEAAALGASLVVGVNSDESVRRLLKGEDRPINSLDDRLAVLAALECVDLVVPFDADTPLELVARVRPEHLVKGGDWTPDRIVGADLVRSYGGSVHSIPVRHGRSTTGIIQRIRRRERTAQ
jgi:rfaE bifunctional protein nucleotidyltransferase chain/domain